MLTHERLKEVLRYDPETGEFRRKPYRNSGRGNKHYERKAGCVRPDGYIVIMIDYKLYLAHRLAWFYMTGEWPLEVDHINRDPGKNEWSNLRNVSHKENCLNTSRSNTTLAVRGTKHGLDRTGAEPHDSPPILAQCRHPGVHGDL